MPIGVTTQFTQNYNANYKVKISHTSKTKCKLYLYVPFAYNDLTYIVNGSYYSFTASNTTLESEPVTDKESTYYRTDSDIITPKTLYDNPTGETGTITLNESAANFSYLEIFAKRGRWYYSEKVHSPNGKSVSLSTNYWQGKGMYVYSKFININEKKITVEFNKLAGFYTNPVAIDIGDDDSHYIVKVLGYR